MKDQQILISDLLVCFLVLMIIYIVWNLITAKTMERIARLKGYGEEFNCFMMCFWLGVVGCLYVIALPDLKQREQLDKLINLLDYHTIDAPTPQDIVRTTPKWLPESPKRDGSAEKHLRRVKKTPEEYKCDRLVVVKKAPLGDCSVCKRKRKKVKICRTVKNDIPTDGLICTDCINVFIECNPTSVFDLDSVLPE